MSRVPKLYWLPDPKDLAGDLDRATHERDVGRFIATAKHNLDFVQTIKVDRAYARAFAATNAGPDRPVKIAVLASSTVSHLFAGIRVGMLRRGLVADIYACDYGQYQQELNDTASGLHTFRPEVTLFVLDTPHMLAGSHVGLDRQGSAEFVASATARQSDLWRAAKQAFGCQVIHQTLLQTQPALMGSNEHRLPGSQRALVGAFNAALQTRADEAGVDVLDLGPSVWRDGLSAWHDPALWHRAKQEISPAAAPAYGDIVARVIAARRGRSAKCLVLDLDNTLWGGVVGDDGLQGIRIGQGDAEGEAFLAFQRYARDLKDRGVILAVCSKNDEANALAPFDTHPEMILRRSDISCFVANWEDKATNIRRIAERLNIGAESLVFADDNPFEREIVRRELPMVAVPEMPDDPALYAACIADAGYFEALQITKEDLDRTSQYLANEKRISLQGSHTNLKDYHASLEMSLRWKHFDAVGLKRITQLINKTNQFNLTTQRYTDQQVIEVIDDPRQIGLQFRLTDRFGDNGIIAITIVHVAPDDWSATIVTWLMSCRVLGRNVEEATLDALVEDARRRGIGRLVGVYRPTAKNAMVRGHYEKLGFTLLDTSDDGSTTWGLSTEDYRSKRESVTLVQEDDLESAGV